MKKKKVDPAKQAEKAGRDAARMKQMGEATARQDGTSRKDVDQAAARIAREATSKD
jgi:hypothetical protein